MPFAGEPSSATAHSDFITNPEISEFLRDCEYIKVPDDKEMVRVKLLFAPYQLNEEPNNIEHVVATDGSLYESQIDLRLPSTRACYVKVSSVLIKMDEFRNLSDKKNNLIDPFKVASLKENNDVFTVVFPGSNLKRKTEKTPRTTFRNQIEHLFNNPRTQFQTDDKSTSLASTYAFLAELRQDSERPANTVRVHRCPNQDCDEPNHFVPTNGAYACPCCKERIYITDSLRLWEEVVDFKSSYEPSSRFMTYLEHLIPIHYIRFLLHSSPSLLSRFAFFVDNPLGIFGNGAWLHAPIMQFYANVRNTLKSKGLRPPLVIGIQKTGQLVDFGRLIERYIAPGTCFPITDEFRQQYIGTGRSENGFGSESYYGQDFFVKTRKGKFFVLSLPYPFAMKSTPGLNFDKEKTKISNYSDLNRAFALVEEVETDLWENALAPVALAHRYTAISLSPSGRILDILGKNLVSKS